MPAACFVSFDQNASPNLKAALQVWGFTLEWLPAIGAKDLEHESSLGSQFNLELMRIRLGREVSSGVIGCALSHRTAYEKLVSSDDDWMLILEDDAVMSFEPEEIPKVQDLLSGLDIQPTVIQLTTRGHRFVSKGATFHDVSGNWRRFRFCYPPGQTVAYLINRSAAHVLLSRQVDGPADWPSSAAEIQFWGVYPWLFHESGRSTTIPMAAQPSLSWRVKQVSGLNALASARRGVSIRHFWIASMGPYLASLWSRRVIKNTPLGPNGPVVAFAYRPTPKASREKRTSKRCEE